MFGWNAARQYKRMWQQEVDRRREVEGELRVLEQDRNRIYDTFEALEEQAAKLEDRMNVATDRLATAIGALTAAIEVLRNAEEHTGAGVPPRQTQVDAD